MKTAALLLACGSASAFAPAATVSRSTALNLAVGEAAPDFSLVDQNGKTFTRSKNKKPLIVYFYPADSTPGCMDSKIKTMTFEDVETKERDTITIPHGTVVVIDRIAAGAVKEFKFKHGIEDAEGTYTYGIQMNAFQEEIQDIRKQYKADVVGISGQGAESKQKFAAELGLDFSILADEGDEIRKAFGVPKAAFGFLPGRVTYVLRADGVCESVYDNLTDAASHIEAAKDALEEMQPAKKEGFSFSLPF